MNGKSMILALLIALGLGTVFMAATVSLAEDKSVNDQSNVMTDPALPEGLSHP